MSHRIPALVTSLPALVTAVAILGLVGCGTSSGATRDDEPDAGAAEQDMIELVKYEQRTQELIDATDQLLELRGSIEEQRRRLSVICNDYPDHDVCAPQTAAHYAREAFCSDDEFTRHVDGVVNACQQGQCKEVDPAAGLSRTDYMVLVQRLPHALITFPANGTKLDGRDHEKLQRFIENIDAHRGYIIIVGRASKDGPWRHNLQLAIKRAEGTRSFLVRDMGMDERRVGYITYGHDKMYLTAVDSERLAGRRVSVTQANRSALVFSYPCFAGDDAHAR